MLSSSFSFHKKNKDKQCSPVERCRFKTCYIHIGTEKTGSSSIQRFLASNRGRLEKAGFCYPRFSGDSGGSQWDFVARIHPDARNTDVGRALQILSDEDEVEFKQTFDTRMTDTFSASPAHNLVISSEHLHSRLTTPEMIENLRKLLLPWVQNFKIIVYFRRQDQVAVSLYSTKIKSGNRNPILFPGSPKNGLLYYFNYEYIYYNWLSVFGEANIIPRRFSSEDWINGQLIDDFCALCEINASELIMPEPENESLSRAGAQFLIEVNKQIPSQFGETSKFNREELTQLVSRLCKGKASHASRSQAKAFYEQFKDSNERLREAAFPHLLAPLFDEDFSMYPEELTNDEPKYEDAVELAIKIWRELR